VGTGRALDPRRPRQDAVRRSIRGKFLFVATSFFTALIPTDSNIPPTISRSQSLSPRSDRSQKRAVTICGSDRTNHVGGPLDAAGGGPKNIVHVLRMCTHRCVRRIFPAKKLESRRIQRCPVELRFLCADRSVSQDSRITQKQSPTFLDNRQPKPNPSFSNLTKFQNLRYGENPPNIPPAALLRSRPAGETVRNNPRAQRALSYNNNPLTGTPPCAWHTRWGGCFGRPAAVFIRQTPPTPAAWGPNGRFRSKMPLRTARGVESMGPSPRGVVCAVMEGAGGVNREVFEGWARPGVRAHREIDVFLASDRFAPSPFSDCSSRILGRRQEPFG